MGMAVFQLDFIKTGDGPDLAPRLYFANSWDRPKFSKYNREEIRLLNYLYILDFFDMLLSVK